MLKFLFFVLVLRLFGYELGIVAQFRDEAFYLGEWVEYHKLLGVDHFWLYNNSSVDHWQEVLQPYIDSGLVEVIDWPSEHQGFQSRHTEALIRTAQENIGIVKWLAMIDIDEFLVPMRDKNLIECLDRHFSEAPAIYASWRMFGTGGIYLNPGKPILAKLNACSMRYHPMNACGKCIVRPEWVDPKRTWSEHYMVLLEGSVGYYNGSSEPLNMDGRGIFSIPIHYDKYLRINHYNLRDENFFQNVRLVKAKKGIYGDVDQFLEHHKAFSMMKDYTIINLLKKHYSQSYETYWNH